MKKPQGFEKKLKVRKKADFLSLRSKSKKFVGRHWIVFFQDNGLGHPRLGISVSTAVGNAVRRNHFRRWIRESFRKHRDRFLTLDCHFVVKKKEITITKREFSKELDEDLERFLHWLS